MKLLKVLVYLDDLIVFGATWEEHEARLLMVLDYLKHEGHTSYLKMGYTQIQIKV